MKDIKVIGVDLAKSVFYLHGVDSLGKTVLKKKLSRKEVLPFFANLPHCLIGMESSCGCHFWAREIMAMGHEVKLMSPQFVKPYIKSNKSDPNDAEGICEAVTRPTMRFVSVKTIDQQDIQSLHRVRERLVSSRTALANEIRGLLLEYGITVKVGIRNLLKELLQIISDDSNKLTSMSRQTFMDLNIELREATERIKSITKKIEDIRDHHPIAQAISTIPGVGAIAATAIIAQVSDPTLFKNGREFSAYLGLVPKHRGTGGKQQNLGISKRGDRYIRTMLIHGARTRMAHSQRMGRTDKTSLWAQDLRERSCWNKAVVALANKTARVVWHALNEGENFKYAG